MNLERIDIFNLKIPFSRSITHSLYTRTVTEGLVIVVRDAHGQLGVGEGTPRTYVTGESLTSSLSAAKQLSEGLFQRRCADFSELDALLTQMGRHECAGRNPAAFCALETALLDLWANVEKKPIYQLFCNPSHQDTLIYSGVIPAAEDKTTLMNYIALVNRLGLASIKIKVTDSAVGLEQLTLMRNHLGREVDIRVDANAAFTADAALQFIKRAKAVKLSAIEQPVPKNDLVGLKRVTDSSNVPIFADESMYTKEGPLHLIDNGICHGINIRLSSCGGFRRAFQLYHHARSNKMLVMLGAHVGETAILSYAGRNLAMMCPAARYLEGSFSTYVLTADLVDEDISLGPGGRVPSPAAPGLGIQIHPCAIKKWAEPFASLSLETPNG